MEVDVHVEKGNHKMVEDLHVHYRDQPLYPDSGNTHAQEVAGWSLLENLAVEFVCVGASSEVSSKEL